MRFVGLDGLRGIAALVVFAVHVGVVRHQASPFAHGHLAVDFFFMLSGFVIGAAYERRMADGLGLARYAQIRLGRLYPMILVGAVLGFAAAPLWAPKDSCLS